MDNTPFSKKCELLNEFYLNYSHDDEFADFIDMNDLGIPAAVLVVNGGAILTDVGESFVEETWQALCEVLEVDHYGEYTSLDELIDFAES
jgi:hypothetical protein